MEKVGVESNNIPLSAPDVHADDRQAVIDLLDGPILSIGPKIEQFEGQLAQASNRRHAIAVSSGTSALHLIVRALGWGEGDEVITTPFSFVASTNCLLYERVTPVFVDIEPETRALDPGRIESAITARTVGILPVDVFGVPSAWARFDDAARRYGLKWITDSCESLGASTRINGEIVKGGQSGVAGAFAFYPNKQITTGEGGAVVTDDDDLAAQCRSMRNQGRDVGAGWLQHARLGFNYRLSELNAALGSSQISRLPSIVASRQRAVDRYAELLAPWRELCDVPHCAGDATASWFVYVIQLADRFTRDDRDAMLQGLRAEGIGCSNYFSPIHLQPYVAQRFGFRRGDFPVTERIADRTIALPFFTQITAEQQARVVEALARQLERAVSARSGVTM
jgi:perosamine synthetase